MKSFLVVACLALAVGVQSAAAGLPVPSRAERPAVAGGWESVTLVMAGEDVGGQLWEAFKKPFPIVLKWVVYALLVGGAIALLVFSRRLWRLLPPRRGTVVALEDLASPVKQRNEASNVLSRQLLTEIASLNSVDRPGAGEIDESADLDRTFLANLRIAGEGVEKLDSLVQGETAVSIGPVGFSPRQVAYFLGSFLRRRSEFELAGSLTAHGERLVLTVERRGASGQVLERWSTTREGANAATAAVRDVAVQIVVGLGCSTATSDWRSFRDYRAALEVLGRTTDGEGADARAQLNEASRLLLRSLDYDSLNPLARFYLATVNRKLGENEAAVEQFDFLEGLAREQSAGRLDRFLHTHPEFRLVVRYNRAASLLKVGRSRDQREALRILNGLLAQLEREDGDPLPFDAAERYRFDVLVRSALAWALTFRLERELQRKRPGDTQSQNRRQAYLDSRMAEIEKARNSVVRLSPEAAQMPSAYASAHATAENAFGRASFLLGRHTLALDAYRRATTVLPDFVDAHLNLAEALLSGVESRWQERAEATLQQALRIDPANARAEYLYGRLCAEESVARFEEAKQHLARAGSYPQALFLQAEILAEHDHDLATAVALLDRAIALAPAPGHRLLSYVNLVLQLAKEGKADREQLDRARERAQRLARDGVTERFRRRGTELLAQIEAAIGASNGGRASPGSLDAPDPAT